MKNILIIDDSKHIRSSLEEFLLINNFNARSVESAEEALGYLKHNEVDLFIVDIGLGGMSGIDFIQKIEILKNPYTAILITSMKYDMESVNKAMKYGAFSYIYKPFEFEDILKIINEAILQSNYKKRKSIDFKNHFNELSQRQANMNDVILSLRNVQNRFEILLNCMDEGILALDTNNCIMFLNKNFAKIINKKPSDCLYLNLENVIEDEALYLDLQSIMFNQTEVKSNEYITINTIEKSCIKSRFYTYHTSQIKNSLDEVIGAILTLSDCTNKIEIDKARYSLLNNLVHELRTPLTSIVSMTSAIKSTPLNQEQNYYIDIMSECEFVLMNHLNHTLDFSKLERNELKIEEELFDLKNICNECMHIVGPLIDDKPISIVSNINKPLSVIGDPNKVKQILLNLLSNAVKFSEKGQIHLHCESEYILDGKVNLCFKVTDPGIGIPEDKRHIIFKDFIQLDDKSNRKFKGTGLGLAITKKLVNLMDGDISVSENSKGGSIFTFNIKVKTDD